MSRIQYSKLEISLSVSTRIARVSGVFRSLGIRILKLFRISTFGFQRFTKCPNLTNLEFTNGLWVLLGALIFLMLFGCGKKGPPIPYDATVPGPVADLESVIRDGKVFLRWSVPRDSEDEPQMAEVKEFWVLREESSLEGTWCEGCPERLERLDTLRTDQMDNFSLVGDRVVYEDRKVSYGHRYVYRVSSVSARGYASELSNRAAVEWDHPPEPPRGVEGIGEDRTVNLRWRSVEDAGAYRIYRKQRGGAFGDVPIAVVGPNQLTHRDTGLSNDVAYSYTVRSVRKVGRTDLEGPGSEEITVVPSDVRPPLPPGGLLAIPLDIGIELSWRRNTEPDLLGYFVYRRSGEAVEYMRLHEFPVQAPIYVDRTVIPGQFYEYGVTAVDNTPQSNESDFSESVGLVYVR